MGSVDLEVVDQVLILLDKHLDVVLGVLAVCCESCLRGLTRWPLAGEIGHQVEDVLAVLVDHLSWEAGDTGALHGGVVPAAHILAVLLEQLHWYWVEPDEGLGSP